MNKEFDPLIDCHYEERVIVFLDILGWKDLVLKSKNDYRQRQSMTIILNAIRSMGVNIKSGGLGVNGNFEFSQFSDSIVFSSSVNQEAVKMLIFLVSNLTQMILNQEFLIRGAITKGELLHKDSIIFGPALNKACDLESKFCIYPRIMIDPEQIDFFSNIFNDNAIRLIFDICVNEDGDQFLDILKPHPGKHKGAAFSLENAYRVMSKIIERYNNGINENKMEEKIKIKNNWFIDYYNESVNRYPETQGYDGKLKKLPHIK